MARHHSSRPSLLGFGRIGWLALAALAVVLVVIAVGVDARDMVAHVIAAAFGGEVPPRFWIQLFSVDITLRLPTLSILGLLVLPIVPRVAGERIAPWRWLVVVAWCAVRSPHLLWAEYVYVPLSWGSAGHGDAWMVTMGVCELGTALVLGVFTHSRRVMFAVLAITFVTYYFWQWPLTTRAYPEGLISHGWQVATFGVLVVWAANQRRRSATVCTWCGYSRRGLTGTVCPECGSVCMNAEDSA